MEPNIAIPADQLLDAAEARATLRIGQSTLSSLVRNKVLQPCTFTRRKWLFRNTDIQRLIATPLETQVGA